MINLNLTVRKLKAIKMTKRMKIEKLLEKIHNIPEEFSDIEDDELYDSDGDLIDNNNVPYGSDNDMFDSGDNDSDYEESSESDGEYENILNIRKRKRNHQLSTSSEEEVEDNEIELAADGTVWRILNEGSSIH
ncbi:hypothetical protein O3M35_006852 [Rhynocoris fuscipes]|uniref:Uncharacterized protein n=1 Tax=Rhynocoris fuscipes TaxID=488301 RepID=A0AAW1DHE9_9HEMI